MSYVKFNRQILNSSRQQFPVENPDVYSAVQHIPDLSSGEARRSDMAIVSEACRSRVVCAPGWNAGARTRTASREFPRGALLSLCFSRDQIEAPPMADHLDQVTAFMDRLQQPVCDFAIDVKASRILFRGGYYLDGADYSLVVALLPNHRGAKSSGQDVPYFLPADLAGELGVEEPCYARAHSAPPGCGGQRWLLIRELSSRTASLRTLTERLSTRARASGGVPS